MTGPIDTGVDFFRQVLALRGYRQEVLSADIANASTPGFKAVDLDFAEALNNAVGNGAAGASAGQSAAMRWQVADARHLPLAGGSASTGNAAASVKYRADGQVSLDGNSVDLDREKLTAATNAVDYEATATFVSQTLRMLSVAVAGSGPQSTGGA